MAGEVPRSRARNLTELYIRAYWRYYAIAVAWVAGTSVLSACTSFPLPPS